MSSLIGLGHTLAVVVPPLLAATAGLLLVAAVADKLLERRVSAARRLFLYLPVLARPLLPLAWESPVGLMPPQTIVADPEVVQGLAATSDRTWWLALVYLLGVVALLARWVAGVLRPRVVLPVALGGEGLTLVLRHESAHVARRDPLLGAVLQIVCIVAWPLLPVWFAARRMRALMELASDERALAGSDGGLRRRYGELLLELADPEPRLAGLAFGSALRARLRALAWPRRWPVPLQATLVTVSALGALALACSGSPSPTAPDDPPAANVRGNLDHAVIRSVVAEHINEVKWCYEQELVRQPNLGGRIVVQFKIDATGAVAASALQTSTMGQPNVESCVVKAVRRWQFPEPEGGGIVIVSYPFILTPGLR
jgi:TonB family protein